MAETDLTAFVGVMLVVDTVEETGTPGLKSFLETLNLLVATGKNTSGAGMVGNLRVETFGHFREMTRHGSGEFAKKFGVAFAEAEVALHLLDKGFRVGGGGDGRVQHPRNNTI